MNFFTNNNIWALRFVAFRPCKVACGFRADLLEAAISLCERDAEMTAIQVRVRQRFERALRFQMRQEFDKSESAVALVHLLRHSQCLKAAQRPVSHLWLARGRRNNKIENEGKRNYKKEKKRKRKPYLKSSSTSLREASKGIFLTLSFVEPASSVVEVVEVPERAGGAEVVR